MKAGIVTINDLNNYGNRLQNYAVFTSLQKLGVSGETLVPKQWAKTIYRQKLEVKIREIYEQNPIEAQEKYPLVVRQFRYEDFNAQFIPHRYLEEKHFQDKLSKEYDYFVVGSDQVWNPMFRDSLGQMRNRLLSFARPEQRVCFSPSIGVDMLEERWKSLFYQELIKYPRLNIREHTGALLIKELTGRDAEVVLDPTLMISKAEWLSIAKPIPGMEIEESYVLYYFLGDEQSEMPQETRELLKQETEQKSLKEYHILDKSNPAICAAGPREFIWLFSKASLVCTDSFHGTVFSILMGKPFVLCERKLENANGEIKMFGRTQSLLEKLGLEENLPEKRKLTAENMWQVDYQKAYEVIETERERMNDILRMSMKLT